MNDDLTLETGSSRNIWKLLFIGTLGLQALLELGLGVALLFDFPTTLESGFGIAYNSELDILGIALGLYLLLLTALMVLSMIWTRKSNGSGITIGIIVGVFLVAFGLVAFFKTGDTQGILIDSLRGGLTIVFAYMAKKELK